jgi:hypothetical protein
MFAWELYFRFCFVVDSQENLFAFPYDLPTLDVVFHSKCSNYFSFHFHSWPLLYLLVYCSFGLCPILLIFLLLSFLLLFALVWWWCELVFDVDAVLTDLCWLSRYLLCHIFCMLKYNCVNLLTNVHIQTSSLWFPHLA